MTIKRITIENIKGIDARTFDLDVAPNKPILLVAPNGFGKSSIAAAFSCLQTNKIVLHENHYHRGDAARIPRLIVEYLDSNGNILPLVATITDNAITAQFDWFVINNQVKAKGIGRRFGGRTNVSASLAIESVVLVDKIPNKESFNYSFQNQKLSFGTNGKILPNITHVFNNLQFIDNLSDYNSTLDALMGARIQGQIDQIKQDTNAQNGSAIALQAWLTTNMIGTLDGITPLRTIADLLLNSNLGITTREQAYLAALQITKLYSSDIQKFKKACKYSNYRLEQEQYESVLKAFNSSWCNISPQKKGEQLVVNFPHAYYISNGQRDVLTFVALLHRARKKLRKSKSILIIDEVFDYLDDANLVAVQYYITQFIETYRNQGRQIYPLIMTHLNPYYFQTFAFNKPKICFLDKRNIVPDPNLVKLLRHRDNALIKDDVSKYLLHYHCSQINKRTEFRTLGLKETWGELDNFDRFIMEEMEKYRSGQNEYDPLAVCCAVRKLVEKLIYDQLTTTALKDEFLNLHTTREKFEHAENAGISVPEYYYLLGIIYNDGMHWRDTRDNISPVAAKLENCTISNLIKQL